MRAEYIRYFAYGFGATYILVGLLGLLLTGFGDLISPVATLIAFRVNPLHNLIHILVGALWVISGARISTARMASQAIGAVYLLLGVVGFFIIGTALDLLALNIADNFLHLVTAIAALYVGFFSPAVARNN
ncbi:MAG: DUF4383 domain-containing protein [Chloroflexota bacterium]